MGQRAGFPGSSWDQAEKGRISLRGGLGGGCSIWRSSVGKPKPTSEVEVVLQPSLRDAEMCEEAN